MKSEMVTITQEQADKLTDAGLKCVVLSYVIPKSVAELFGISDAEMNTSPQKVESTRATSKKKRGPRIHSFRLSAKIPKGTFRTRPFSLSSQARNVVMDTMNPSLTYSREWVCQLLEKKGFSPDQSLWLAKNLLRDGILIDARNAPQRDMH